MHEVCISHKIPPVRVKQKEEAYKKNLEESIVGMKGNSLNQGLTSVKA